MGIKFLILQNYRFDFLDQEFGTLPTETIQKRKYQLFYLRPDHYSPQKAKIVIENNKSRFLQHIVFQNTKLDFLHQGLNQQILLVVGYEKKQLLSIAFQTFLPFIEILMLVTRQKALPILTFRRSKSTFFESTYFPALLHLWKSQWSVFHNKRTFQEKVILFSASKSWQAQNVKSAINFKDIGFQSHNSPNHNLDFLHQGSQLSTARYWRRTIQQKNHWIWSFRCNPDSPEKPKIENNFFISRYSNSYFSVIIGLTFSNKALINTLLSLDILCLLYKQQSFMLFCTIYFYWYFVDIRTHNLVF